MRSFEFYLGPSAKTEGEGLKRNAATRGKTNIYTLVSGYVVLVRATSCSLTCRLLSLRPSHGGPS